MRPPSPHPFLGAEAGEPRPGADALIVGLATDGGVSFRPGAAEGPSGIRRFSESIESYSPRAQRDLAEVRVVDCGDHTDWESIPSAVGEVLEAAWGGEARPPLLCLGGDHSVTPPVVSEVAARTQGLALVGFDAHLDLRESFEGDHACTYRRIWERGVDCFVFGVRSGAKQEWDDVPKVLAGCSPSLDVGPALESLAGRPVYVTVDIDVLDPSAAPGTGNPEPGGSSFTELLEALERVFVLDVVALDVVEVSPPLDPSGVTQAAAAVLAREALLRLA